MNALLDSLHEIFAPWSSRARMFLALDWERTAGLGTNPMFFTHQEWLEHHERTR